MPQFDITTFPTQLIWLVISFVLLYLLMSRVALPRIGQVLEARQEKIDDNLDAAVNLRAEANKDAAAYDDALAQARETARGAIQEAARSAADEAANQHDKLGRQLGKNIQAAEANIADAKDAAISSIREAAIDTAISATMRLIGVKPSNDAAAAAVDKALAGRG
ncbi:MAG: F0F1 ATP synthase subunit B' [Rhodospirillales bacterium]|nr:F0F1 ATP synthase subunit B' [Rhodospirillales bacterium]